MVKSFRFDDFGFEVEIGKMARQADGAVLLKRGGTVLLAAVTSAESNEFPGFLPLTVDYRELSSAAGKIPGGYYKREGKPSEREVLTGRLIDRAIRPLFPSDFFNQVQVSVTVYSVDKEYEPNTMSLLAVSLALTISKIPFMGSVGVVEVGRVEGEWIINPTYPEMKKSDVRFVFAGTDEGICMVEGESRGVKEEEFVDIMFRAHTEIKKLVAWQQSIGDQIGISKVMPKDRYQWNLWQERVESFLTNEMVEKVYVNDKVERNNHLDAIRNNFIEYFKQDITDKSVPVKVIDYMVDAVLKDRITEQVFKVNKRVDGRSMEKVRDIQIEVGILPRTHGSALFTRGRTQALATVTLGSGQDEQRLESVMVSEEEKSAFMLHYNFPPFSVGEVRPMRGPGRREIGHGSLASSALKRVLPTVESFPYTIRIVCDILESDGSSSMATVCASTMGLMQAGVPISDMVAGVAMGLLKSSTGDFKVLTDIAGFEDAFGLMDFKVAGTETGITAIQMDIKHKGGLTREIFDISMKNAREARLHILREMKKVMSEPSKELSDLVPRVISFTINTDKIGAVIGGGGKTIREIIETTKTQIDIEGDGIVKIFGGPEADIEGAVRWVRVLAGQIKRGDIFEGKIRRIADFGLFVELVPGLDGLLHVSNIAREKQRTFSKDFQVNDVVKVEVMDYDPTTGRVGLRQI